MTKMANFKKAMNSAKRSNLPSRKLSSFPCVFYGWTVFLKFDDPKAKCSLSHFSWIFLRNLKTLSSKTFVSFYFHLLIFILDVLTPVLWPHSLSSGFYQQKK